MFLDDSVPSGSEPADIEYTLFVDKEDAAAPGNPAAITVNGAAIAATRGHSDHTIRGCNM